MVADFVARAKARDPALIISAIPCSEIGTGLCLIDQVVDAAQALMMRGPSTIVITSAELTDTPDHDRCSPRGAQRVHGGLAWYLDPF